MSSEDEDSMSIIEDYSQESGENDDLNDSMGEVGSDEEDLESGRFLENIKKETEKAIKEKRYLIKELRAKERRGSIFFDKI